MSSEKPREMRRISVDALIPYARNARTHSDAQIAQIAASIKEFGWTNPILVDGENGIIAGHGRILAARKLGITEVPVIELSGLTEAQKRAYVIADNKIALNAGWDEKLLRVELGDLGELGVDLDVAGFSEPELVSALLDREHGKTDADEEWIGMPQYEAVDPCYRKVVVNFDDEAAVAEFFSLLGQSYTDKTKSIWHPEKERNNLKDMAWRDSGEE